jgi:hypothetical protein
MINFTDEEIAVLCTTMEMMEDCFINSLDEFNLIANTFYTAKDKIDKAYDEVMS